MKYLHAFLENEENSTLPQEEARQNRQKGLLSGLSGASPRGVKEIEEIPQRSSKGSESRRPPGNTVPESRALYRQAAEAIRDDCCPIDSLWLIENHPQIWHRLVALDRQIGRLEQRGAEPAEIEAMLDQLVQTVRQAGELYQQGMTFDAVSERCSKEKRRWREFIGLDLQPECNDDQKQRCANFVGSSTRYYKPTIL